MKTFLFELFAATADGASVYVSQGLEKSGIEFDRVIGFRESEFGYRGVELKLQALQENGMVDAAFGAAPAENAVAENELDALGFAVDAAIEGVKGLEDSHSGASGLFSLSPFLARHLPAL